MAFGKPDPVFDLPVHYPSLTWDERKQVRRQYIREQDGQCYFCKHPLIGPPHVNYNLDMRLFPENFLKHPIHLHHDHGTGLTIGAVHAKCNGVLWQYFGE